ncbi:MAG TPA: molybdate ABC transporter substrate-binding protein [Thermoanaerobaculia bacterium]|jgi:molybdate transport system substrate-binding protein|nr:molybdate ABC transporter substrate-binding protein [Thermoanaerobaculia bacterium]
MTNSQERRIQGILVFGLFVLACMSGFLPLAAAGAKGEVRVAAAADLKFAMDELIAEFRKERPDITVTASYGSSGNFYSQLSNRAPFDVFFSADRQFVDKLVAQDVTLPDSEFLYAVGRIVLWVSRSSSLAVEERGIAILKDPAVRRIAIANPRHAPYGSAAVAALRSLGVYEAVKDKLVLGENVAQTAQFVQTGAAEAGVIALSLAVAPSLRKDGRFWSIPVDAYPRMDQGGVILKWARDPEAARSFRSFVLSPAGHELLKKYGFGLPKK